MSMLPPKYKLFLRNKTGEKMDAGEVIPSFEDPEEWLIKFKSEASLTIYVEDRIGDRVHGKLRTSQGLKRMYWYPSGACYEPTSPTCGTPYTAGDVEIDTYEDMVNYLEDVG